MAADTAPDTARAARLLLRAGHTGILSTLSARFGGHPFGSVVNYLVDQDGSLLILASTLAEHTRNIAADRRVSLIVLEPGAENTALDVQSRGRVTLLGEAGLEPDPATAVRYQRYFPEAAGLLGLGDFSFYRIQPVTLRYIGGFGRIHWVSREKYQVLPFPGSAEESRMLEEINRTYSHELAQCCETESGMQPTAVAMVGVDSDGFDIRATGASGLLSLHRHHFAEPVSTPDALHHAIRQVIKAGVAA